MRLVDTAFAQLQFAIKLWHAAEQGELDAHRIDVPLTLVEGTGMHVLPDRLFEAHGQFVTACSNNLTLAIGGALITLNRCREEANVTVPNRIETRRDQWVALVYQLRNTFAHDMAAPRWEIRRSEHRRLYQVGRVTADLRAFHETPLLVTDIGGVDALFSLKAIGEAHAWGRCWDDAIEHPSWTDATRRELPTA